MELSLDHITEVVQGELSGNAKKTPISSISIDSRSMMNPTNTVFFALVGERHNGHHFISALLKKGIKAFIVSQIDPQWLNTSDACFIKVSNTTTALQTLAIYKRSKFLGEVIGITGSNGKTIVKEWLSQLLSANLKVSRSPKSYNSQVGVPLSLWMARDLDDLWIIEAGISQTEEMRLLNKMIQPSITVLTNIGPAHQENFASVQEKTIEKLKLANDAKIVIYCADDEIITDYLIRNADVISHRSIGWSLNGKGDINATIVSQTRKSTTLSLRLKESKLKFSIPFTDQASIENCLTCFTTMVALNLDPKLIVPRFEFLEPVAMRLELKKGQGKGLIINDAYNSDLGSLSIALDFLNQQSAEQTLKHTVILSDIQQSGENMEQLINQVNRLLVDKKVDRLLGVGSEISRYQHLFSMDASFYKSTEELLDNINPWDFKDEAILIKGARKFEFEKISARLEYKVHRTTLEIDLTALTHNFNHFRSLLKPNTRIMGMVKAFAYGSGSYEIARLLQYHGIDYLAVAVADEGVELRNAGITIPIVVMTPEPNSFEVMIENALEPEIYSMEELIAFDRKLASFGLQQYPIHLKIDTGMHRLGFLKNELPELLCFLQEHANLHVSSVFTHLAGADEKDLDVFTMHQITHYKELADEIEQSLNQAVIKHVLNSAGTERFTEHQMNMVRLGIGLYGVSAIQNNQLEHVSTLKTRIAQVKSVLKKETVGYGRKGILQRDSRIAILPIGYADGLNRLLGNGKGYVLIGNNKAPYVGNICMDLCMVDVTGLEVNAGDEAIIFGKELPISLHANWLNTIPYEIITSISSRVKRVFLRE